MVRHKTKECAGSEHSNKAELSKFERQIFNQVSLQFWDTVDKLVWIDLSLKLK